MELAEKEYLQKISALLFDSFEPVDLLPAFLVQELITDDDVSRIRAERERRFRVADLLALMQRNFPTLDPFLSALSQHGYSQLSQQLRYGYSSFAPQFNADGSASAFRRNFNWSGRGPHHNPFHRYGHGFSSTFTPTVDALLLPNIPPPPPLPALSAPHPNHHTSQPHHLAHAHHSVSWRDLSSPLSGQFCPDSGFLRVNRGLGNTKRLRQFFEATLSGMPHPADMEFLLATTPFSEREIIEWFREFAIACPNGRLSKPQFIKFYKYLDPNEPYTTQYCEHVFRVFDKDRSGFIDYKEFLLALNIKFNGSPREKLEWTFKLFDIDGNGTLDLNEMISIIETLYDMLSKSDLHGGSRRLMATETGEVIFRKMDRNRDGKISVEEFVNGCLDDHNLYSILTQASTATLA